MRAIEPVSHRPRESVLLTADLVVVTIRDGRLQLLLVKRRKDPFKWRLALPGGFMRPGECIEQTALRELAEETGLNGSLLPLRQMGTYSAEDRDPRGRVVSVAFLAIAPDLPEPVGGTDAASADWVEVEESLPGRLAFDHAMIVNDGLEQARQQLEHTTLAAAFCAPVFTIPELGRVYEIMWSVPIDMANFRRKVLTSNEGFVEAVGSKRQNPAGGPPADLYRRGSAERLVRPILRPSVRQSSDAARIEHL